MKLADIGEFALHEWIQRRVPQEPINVLGNADDCAALAFPHPNALLLVSTDRTPSDLEGRYAGRFCVMHNFSDIVSKGGVPVGILLAVMLPRETELAVLEQIIEGVLEELSKYDAALLGGDLKEDNKQRIVGTAIGTVQRDELIPRVGARVGDIVAITLTQGKKLGCRWAYLVSRYFELELDENIVARYSILDLPFAEMRQIAKLKVATSSLDMSDGIGGSLVILRRMNGVGFRVDYGALRACVSPYVLHTARELRTDPVKFALSPGSDWECLVTLRPDRLEIAQKAVQAVGGELMPIGEVIDGADILLRKDGEDAHLQIISDEKFQNYLWEDKALYWLQQEYCY